MPDFQYGGSAPASGSSFSEEEQRKKAAVGAAPDTATGAVSSAMGATAQPVQQSGTPAAAPAPQPGVAQNFQQLQASGQARPAPPPPAPVAPPTDIRSMIQSQMSNPTSSYDDAAMTRDFERGARKIDDTYTTDQARLIEEMAGRGLNDSSIRGGRSADLNVGKRSAETELMDSLQSKRADASDRARESAMVKALQLMGMDQDAALAAAQLAQSQDQFTKSSAQRADEFTRNFDFTKSEADKGHDEWAQGFKQRDDQFNKNYDFTTGEAAKGHDEWAKDFGQRGDQFKANLDWAKESGGNQTVLDFLRYFGIDGIGSAGDVPASSDVGAGGDQYGSSYITPTNPDSQYGGKPKQEYVEDDYGGWSLQDVPDGATGNGRVY